MDVNHQVDSFLYDQQCGGWMITIYTLLCVSGVYEIINLLFCL